MDGEPNCVYCRRPGSTVCRYCSDLHEDIWIRTCPPKYRTTDPKKLIELTKVPSVSFEKVLGRKYGPRGMILYGRPGTGKTRSMWMLMRRWHDEGHRIAAFNMASPDATFSLQVAKMFMNHDACEWMERIQSASTLMWDDMDKDKLTERAEETAFAMIEHFTSNNKPVMLTTNASAEEFRMKFTGDRGAAILRRIREFCTGVQFAPVTTGGAK